MRTTAAQRLDRLPETAFHRRPAAMIGLGLRFDAFGWCRVEAGEENGAVLPLHVQLHDSTLQWKYPDRAMDRKGQTVDFLLTARRDESAARRFLTQAIDVHDAPEKVTIDKSATDTPLSKGW